MKGDKKIIESSNWGELHPDLLHSIYKNFDETLDIINFRAVCKWWREAAPLSEHPPLFPLLFERKQLFSSEFQQYSLVKKQLFSSEFQLYSIRTGKSYRHRVPEAKNKKFFGQSNGYLVTFLDCGANNYASPALLNPFTRAELPLHFPKFKRPLYGGRILANLEFYQPIYIGADPIRNPREVVIYMSSPHTGLCVWFQNSENNEWALKYDLPDLVQAYYKGRIFFSNYQIQSSSTMAIDLTTGEKLEVQLPNNRQFCYLVEGAGSLLGIQSFHFVQIDIAPLEKCRFEVFRLDEEQKPPCWVKMSDIGDLIIFLNPRDGFCLSASDFDGIRGNCIYFTKIGRDSQLLIGRYELGKNESEVVGHRSYSNAIWIVPNFY